MNKRTIYLDRYAQNLRNEKNRSTKLYKQRVYFAEKHGRTPVSLGETANLDTDNTRCDRDIEYAMDHKRA